MPTYDYQCESCGKTTEVFHGFNEQGPETCSCGARGTMRRLISSGAGLIFKGSGFYATDYKNGKPEGKTSKETKPEKAAETPAAGPCGSAACASGCQGETKK